MSFLEVDRYYLPTAIDFEKNYLQIASPDIHDRRQLLHWANRR